MKKTLIIFISLLCFFVSGCGTGSVEEITFSDYETLMGNNESFSQAGCAPASAYMITDGTEKEADGLREAAALARKYQNKNGVSSEYFGHYFKKKGLDSRYVSSSNDITSSLLSGDQVVLGGQNASNTSKAKSPFGPGGHYVVANGITEDGKYIQINDPEASEPNKLYPSREILKSTKVGIAAGRGTGILFKGKGSAFYGGSTLPGSSTAEKCWNYLKSCGFSDAAAAGVLGNLKAESGVDPTRLQNGKGPAAGICQWETYGKSNTRWGKMAALAKSKGRPWTDLESQLQFMISELPANFKSYTGKTYTYSNGTKTWWPVKMTLEDFKKLNDVAKATEIFERVFERPSKPHRAKRISYAQQYYNQFSGKYTPVTGISSADGYSESSASTGSVLDQLLGVWDTMAGAYGLTKAGASESNVSEVIGTGGVGNATQQDLVKTMQSKEGKLKYSMSGPRNPDKGSADCSSTVNWAYKKVTGVDVGNSTPAMYNNKNTTTVDTGNGSKSSKPDESKLQPGDLLLYWRDWSKHRAPDGVGHVEMYIGNGKQIGHGGGKGPKTKNLGGNFLRARRLNKFMGKGSEMFSGKGVGSSIVRYGKGSSASNASLSSSSVLYSNTTSATVPTSSYSTTSSSSSGMTLLPMGVSSSNGTVSYTAELMNIVALLTKVVDNTSLLQSIVSVLTEVLGIMSEEVEAKKSNNKSKLEQLQAKKQSLFNTLGSMTSGSGNDQIALLIKNAEKLAKA